MHRLQLCFVAAMNNHMQLQYFLFLFILSVSSYAAPDIKAGEKLYTSCFICHGKNGEGNKALNAPRLAGQEDWYLARQLKNFKEGIRGAHPKDSNGMMMAPMAKILKNDKEIEDVSAYIAQLPVRVTPQKK